MRMTVYSDEQYEHRNLRVQLASDDGGSGGATVVVTLTGDSDEFDDTAGVVGDIVDGLSNTAWPQLIFRDDCGGSEMV